MSGLRMSEGRTIKLQKKATGKKLPRKRDPKHSLYDIDFDMYTVDTVRDAEGLKRLGELVGMDDEEIRMDPDGTPIKKTVKKAKKKKKSSKGLKKQKYKEDTDSLEQSLDSISVCAEDDLLVDDFFADNEGDLQTAVEKAMQDKMGSFLPEDVTSLDSVPGYVPTTMDSAGTQVDMFNNELAKLSKAFEEASKGIQGFEHTLSMQHDKMDDLDRENRSLRQAITELHGHVYDNKNRLDKVEDDNGN